MNVAPKSTLCENSHDRGTGESAEEADWECPVDDISAPGQASCALCDLGAVDSLRTICGASWRVEYLDDGVVALIEPGRPGIVIVSRSHLNLSVSPEVAGVVLGALRRAACHVQSTYGTRGSAIERLDVPGAPGHGCYRVVPTPTDQPSDFSPDPPVEARRFGEAVRS